MSEQTLKSLDVVKALPESFKHFLIGLMQVTSTHSVNMQPYVWHCAGSKDTAISIDPDAFALQKQAGSQGETDKQIISALCYQHSDHVHTDIPSLCFNRLKENVLAHLA